MEKNRFVEDLFQKMADAPSDDYTVELNRWLPDQSAILSVTGHGPRVLARAKISCQPYRPGSPHLVRVVAVDKDGKEDGTPVEMTMIPSAVLAVILR